MVDAKRFLQAEVGRFKAEGKKEGVVMDGVVSSGNSFEFSSFDEVVD